MSGNVSGYALATGVRVGRLIDEAARLRLAQKAALERQEEDIEALQVAPPPSPHPHRSPPHPAALPTHRAKHARTHALLTHGAAIHLIYT